MGRMLINMIRAVEPVFAKRHERWVAFVFVSSANNLLSLTMQIQKRAPNTSSSPRDAHVNRALDLISCHKGFRTAEASESRESGHFPCRDEWPPCDWYQESDIGHIILCRCRGVGSTLLTEMNNLAICPLSHLLQSSHGIKTDFNYLPYSFT